MINTIIFDIGNVLADFKWREYLEGYGFPEEMTKLLAETIYLSPLWHEVDRGVMTNEEILEKMCANAPQYAEEIRTVYLGTVAAVRPNYYTMELLKSLREKGYRVYILSNYGEYFFKQAQKYFDFMKYIDGSVVSYEVKVIKPDPVIYRTLLEKYGIVPENALFFDDLPQNVEAAGKLGIHAVQVTGYESIVKGLETFGVC